MKEQATKQREEGSRKRQSECKGPEEENMLGLFEGEQEVRVVESGWGRAGAGHLGPCRPLRRTLALGCGSISCSCCNKYHKLGGLKQQKLVSDRSAP